MGRGRLPDVVVFMMPIVVRVGVLVNHGLVDMQMAMLLPNQDCRSDYHQNQGQEESQRRRTPE